MRSSVVFLGLIAVTEVAHAQSRADREPPSRPDVQLPLAPAPSDEIRDHPSATYPEPELVSPPPEPDTKLVLQSSVSDTLSHHLLLNLGASYVNPFGNLDSATSISTRIAGGYGANVGVGYGLSRYVEVELEGSMTAFGAATECPNCNAKAYDVVGAIRYHLVQGVRFDPWVRVGIGVSVLRLDENRINRNYTGLQWLNASVGGDWYFSHNFGFGPLLSLAMTSYLDHPNGSSTSVAFKWLAGINMTFDSSGK